MLIYLFSVVLNVGCWVNWGFFCVWYWCPSAVGIESGRILAMLFSVKKGYIERLFFLWRSGAWYLLYFPCFYARSWGYHSLLPLVGSHWSVVLPVVLLVGWFHLMGTSTVWWLVTCNLLMLFSCLCLPAQSVLWMWLYIPYHTVMGWTRVAPVCHRIHMLYLTVPVAHPFLFCIVCVRWFCFHLVAGPLLVLFVCRSWLDYSYTNSYGGPNIRYWI